MKYLLNRLINRLTNKDGFWWIIPAVAGVAVGAAKHSSDSKNYKKDIETRNRRRTFAAFTGDMPSDATKPQRPSALSTIGGTAILGGQLGANLQNMYSQSMMQAPQQTFQGLDPRLTQLYNPYVGGY